MLNTVTATESPPTYAPLSLLRQLVADPGLRAKLEADPAALFAEHGIKVTLPAEVRIPDQTVIASALEDSRTGSSGSTTGGDIQWAGLLG